MEVTEKKFYQDKRVYTFDTQDEISNKVISFVNSGCDIEKGKYVGVTKVLDATSDKTFLEEWRNRVGDIEADRIIKESQDIGNSLDNLLLQSFLPNFDEKEYRKEIGYSLYTQLSLPLKKIKPVALQLKLWSERYKIMGYLDCLGYYNGELSLIDFKNSKRFKKPEHYHNYLLQCTMYCIMIQELFGVPVKQIVLLIGIRNDHSPQIVTKRTKDYVKDAIKRINDFNSKRNESNDLSKRIITESN